MQHDTAHSPHKRFWNRNHINLKKRCTIYLFFISEAVYKSWVKLLSQWNYFLLSSVVWEGALLETTLMILSGYVTGKNTCDTDSISEAPSLWDFLKTWRSTRVCRLTSRVTQSVECLMLVLFRSHWVSHLLIHQTQMVLFLVILASPLPQGTKTERWFINLSHTMFFSKTWLRIFIAYI